MVIYAEKFNIKWSIILFFAMCSIITAFIPVSEFLFNQHIIYIIVLSSSGLLGFFNAVNVSNLTAFVNNLPEKYIVRAIGGQAFGGILSSTIRITNKFIFESHPNGIRIGGKITFAIIVFWEIISIILFVYAVKTAFVKYYLQNKLNTSHNSTSHTSENESDMLVEDMIVVANKGKWSRYWMIFKKIKALILGQAINMTCTALITGGLLFDMKSTNEYLNDTDWMPVILGALWDVCDFLACNFIGSYNLCITNKNLWIFCCLRVLCYPPFIIMHQAVYQSDYLLYAMVIIAAMPSGYFSVLNFKFIPSMLNKDELEIAAAMMQFSTAIGLFVGVYIALTVSFVLGVSE